MAKRTLVYTLMYHEGYLIGSSFKRSGNLYEKIWDIYLFGSKEPGEILEVNDEHDKQGKVFYFDFKKLKCYCNNSRNREEHL